MGDFIGFILICFACVTFFYFAGGCADEKTKAGIIRENGFCIHAHTTGQKFEKCYEVKER